MRETYGNCLRVGDSAKTIPYEPSVRPHGQPSFGFRSLKGQRDAVRFIPEAYLDPALRAFLLAANDSRTAIFTVGCGSVARGDDTGHWYRGYVKFALNDVYAVRSAAEYCMIFLEFDRAWRDARGDYRVGFVWELARALFRVRDVEGFTFTIWIETGKYTSPGDADACWRHALDALQELLVNVPVVDGGELLY